MGRAHRGRPTRRGGRNLKGTALAYEQGWGTASPTRHGRGGGSFVPDTSESLPHFNKIRLGRRKILLVVFYRKKSLAVCKGKRYPNVYGREAILVGRDKPHSYAMRG